MNEYILEYNLSGYKDFIVKIEGKQSFFELNDETKFEHMSNVKNLVRTAIIKNNFSSKNEEDLTKLFKNNKVILNVKGNKYIYI